MMKWRAPKHSSVDLKLLTPNTVVDNMYDLLDTGTERRLIDDFNAPRIGNMLRIPIFGWPTKAKHPGGPMVFNLRWLLIASGDSWSKKV